MRTFPKLHRPTLPDLGTGEAVGYGNAFSDYWHIRDYVRIVYHRRWMIIGILAVGLLSGVLRNWMTAPMFAAQATLQLDTDVNVLGVDRISLEHEANSNREVLDKLLQRSREATLARQQQSTNVRIVDPAEVPVSPVFPRKERMLIVALVASGGLSLALILGIKIFNTRVTSPQDVHLRIPVLGIMPQVKSLNGRRSLLLGNGTPTQFVELFQGLRTNLVLAPELAAGRTLLVTSSEADEGKTVSAANVAVSLAGLKRRVLLVDGDLQRPRLHEVFGEEQEPGLADLLTGKAATHHFRKTNVPGLWLMPAGSSTENAADLLGSEHFSELMNFLHKQFDWIVIDSSPVLAVTDPCVIAKSVSGVLLVVDCSHTGREVASAAIERLDRAGARIVGAMLNRVVLDRYSDSYLTYYLRNNKTDDGQQKDNFRPPRASRR